METAGHGTWTWRGIGFPSHHDRVTKDIDVVHRLAGPGLNDEGEPQSETGAEKGVHEGQFPDWLQGMQITVSTKGEYATQSPSPPSMLVATSAGLAKGEPCDCSCTSMLVMAS